MAETSKSSIVLPPTEIETSTADLTDALPKETEGSPRRKGSITSITSDAEEDLDNEGGKLMTDEFQEREKGAVDREAYIAWAKAGGGISYGVVVLFMFAFVELLSVGSKWWLTHWSESGGSNPFFFLGIYAVINFGAIFATFFRIILFISAGLRASRQMFERLLDVVLFAPMSFFDT